MKKMDLLVGEAMGLCLAKLVVAVARSCGMENNLTAVCLYDVFLSVKDSMVRFISVDAVFCSLPYDTSAD